MLLGRGGYISYAAVGIAADRGIITGEKELTLQTPQSFFARVQIDAHFKNEAL